MCQRFDVYKMLSSQTDDDLEGSLNALSKVVYGRTPRLCRVLKLGLTLALSPSRVGEAAKNRKNWLPTGRERKKGGG